jgi:hypothetical protein
MEVAQILSNIGLIDLIQAFERMKGMSRVNVKRPSFYDNKINTKASIDKLKIETSSSRVSSSQSINLDNVTIPILGLKENQRQQAISTLMTIFIHHIQIFINKLTTYLKKRGCVTVSVSQNKFQRNKFHMRFIPPVLSSSLKGWLCFFFFLRIFSC